MPGFFDLPRELRDIIWTEAIYDIKAPEPTQWRCDTFEITFHKYGEKVSVHDKAAWEWLQTVSAVSKAFAREGRPRFFESRGFALTEVSRTADPGADVPDASAGHFVGLRSFLQWAGDDACHISKITVYQLYNDQKLDRPDILVPLNELDVAKLGLSTGLRVLMNWNMGRQMWELTAELGEGGRFAENRKAGYYDMPRRQVDPVLRDPSCIFR